MLLMVPSGGDDGPNGLGTPAVPPRGPVVGFVWERRGGDIGTELALGGDVGRGGRGGGEDRKSRVSRVALE